MKHKDPQEAKRYVLSAFAEAPRFRDAQKLLLKMEEKEQEPQKPEPENNVQDEAPDVSQEDIQ